MKTANTQNQTNAFQGQELSDTDLQDVNGGLIGCAIGIGIGIGAAGAYLLWGTSDSTDYEKAKTNRLENMERRAGLRD